MNKMEIKIDKQNNRATLEITDEDLARGWYRRAGAADPRGVLVPVGQSCRLYLFLPAGLP